MTGRTAVGGRRRGGARRGLALTVAVAAAVAWLLAARALWQTTAPPDLALPEAAGRAAFSPGFLSASASFERFLTVDALLG